MFENREEAGRKLCPKLKKFSDKKDVVIVGLTRGGIVTAKVISLDLKLKLIPLVVKKIGFPGNDELALGALVSSKDVYWNKNIALSLKLDKIHKSRLILRQEQEVNKLNQELGIKRNASEFKNKITVLVDDGVATGASVMAAYKYLKRLKAKKIILASPIIAYDTLVYIKRYFDDVIYLEKHRNFYAVGQFYNNFQQVSNQEVASLLSNHH